MDTDIVYMVYIKIDDIHRDIAGDIKARFNTSNYELKCSSTGKLLSNWKSKNLIGLMKDKLGWKIMTKFVGLRAKTYSYLIDDCSEDKKAKATAKCVMKRKLKFENYKNCLEANQLENKTSFLERNKIDLDSIKENHK